MTDARDTVTVSSMRNPFRKRRPEPDDGRPTYQAQHAALDEITAGLRDGTISQQEAGQRALAVGPVRGSFGDYSGRSCHHLIGYPGCSGGCGG